MSQGIISGATPFVVNEEHDASKIINTLLE